MTTYEHSVIPAFHKTWLYWDNIIDNAQVDMTGKFASGYTANGYKAVIWLKEILVQLLGWSVVASSNGVAYAASDLISDSSDLGFGKDYESSKYSWFLIQSSVGPWQIYVGKESVISNKFRIIWSPSGAFSGGDAVHRPVASDEIDLGVVSFPYSDDAFRVRYSSDKRVVRIQIFPNYYGLSRRCIPYFSLHIEQICNPTLGDSSVIILNQSGAPRGPNVISYLQNGKRVYLKENSALPTQWGGDAFPVQAKAVKLVEEYYSPDSTKYGYLYDIWYNQVWQHLDYISGVFPNLYPEEELYAGKNYPLIGFYGIVYPKSTTEVQLYKELEPYSEDIPFFDIECEELSGAEYVESILDAYTPYRYGTLGYGLYHYGGTGENDGGPVLLSSTPVEGEHVVWNPDYSVVIASPVGIVKDSVTLVAWSSYKPGTLLIDCGKYSPALPEVLAGEYNYVNTGHDCVYVNSSHMWLFADPHAEFTLVSTTITCTDNDGIDYTVTRTFYVAGRYWEASGGGGGSGSLGQTLPSTPNSIYAVIEYRDLRTNQVFKGNLSSTGGAKVSFQRSIVNPQDRVYRLAGYKDGTRAVGIGNLGVQVGNGSRALTQYGPTRTSQRANSAVYIDPITKDVAIDYTGKELGVDPVQQRIQLLLATVPGSIEIRPDYGFKNPSKATEDVAKQLSSLISKALQPMVKDRTIEIVRVTAFYQS